MREMAIMALQLFELVGTDEDRPFSPFCWRTRMALAHKGLEATSIPWRFTEKDAISQHKSEKVPVLLDGERAVSELLGDRQLSRRHLSGSSVAVRRRGRPRDGAHDQLVGRHGRGRRHVSVHRGGHSRPSASGRSGLFPREPRSAIQEVAGRGRIQSRHGRRCVSASRSIRCG